MSQQKLHHKYNKFFDLKKILSDIKSYIPTFNEKRFLKAFYFAEHAHRKQMRKDGITPYFVHPISVVKILIKYHADEDILITALLHDVPEDTKHTVKEVEEMFGSDVAFLVDGITKLSALKYKGNMSSRKIGTLKKMFVHTAKDPRVVLVKLADRLHNMRTLRNVKPEKQIRIARETIELFVPIANLLGIQEIKTELEDLCFMHLFPKEYENLKNTIKEKVKENEESVNLFIKETKKILKKSDINCDIVPRNKGLYSIFKKVHINKYNIDGRASLIIVVDDIPKCYTALGLIHSEFTPHSKRFKDYIANPKINRYQSLHTTVFGINGLYTEIQIRTKSMHLNALYGITSYFFENKNTKKMLQDIRSSWVNKILEDNENSNQNYNFIENLKSDIFNERIFVYTENGEKYNLPAGACGIDLAFLIDNKKGKQAEKIIINGRTQAITTMLSVGDSIKIKYNKVSQAKLIWLSFIKTSNARIAILKALRKSPKNFRTHNGKILLQKEFDIAGFGLVNKHKIENILEDLNQNFNTELKSISDLWMEIGSGTINAVDVISVIRKTRTRNKINQNITIKIITQKRNGTLKDISSILYKNTAEMFYLKAEDSKKSNKSFFTVKIKIDNPQKLAYMFDELEQVEGLITAYRIPTIKLLITNLLITFSVLIWLLHPFIFKYIVHTNLVQKKPILTSLAVYSGLLLLFVLIMKVVSLIKQHIAYARQKTLIWVASFTIPMIVVITVLIEHFYLQTFTLNFWVLSVETIILYIYLISSFYELKDR